MFSVVGAQIYIHQGDECAFRIVHKDNSGEILDFDPADIITLTIRDMQTKKIILSKVAESIAFEDSSTMIFSFFVKDYQELTPNTYLYDVILETGTGAQYTLVDKAYFTVVESESSIDYSSLNIETGRLSPFGSDSLYLSETALVCKFNHKMMRKDEVDGTLILFDRLQHNISESEGEDTLILFSNTPKKKDDTLILF